MEEDKILNERKEKAINFLKKNYNWITYAILAVIVFIAVRLRSLNIPKLKDVTTGSWTLGPDLDPFLFLRWSKYIVEHGSLFAVDTMRYVPVGLSTSEEYLLHPYMMAWLHHVFSFFGLSDSVTYSAIIYPVFFFALTVVIFFFFSRKMFINPLGNKKANIIALISSFFLIVMPVLLPRTIAGIPEKESAGFFFMFLSFFMFLVSWDSKKSSNRYIFAVLAGLSTATMANIWGGYIFIFITIAPAVFLAFLMEKVDRERIITYSIWVFSAFLIMSITSIQFSPINLLSSTYTASAILVLLVMLVHPSIYCSRFKQYLTHEKIRKIPPKFISSIITLILLILLATIFFGPQFIPGQVNNLLDNLVKPATSRLIQTVAENRQPYFTEWSSSFGPTVRGVPISFWLFFIGSVWLFYNSIDFLKKNEKAVLTTAFSVFLTTIVFSRYSANSSLNGENTLSLFLYASGFLFFVITLAYFYFKRYNEGQLGDYKKADFGFIFILIMLTLGIISARGAIRLVMVLAPSLSIVIAYFVVTLSSNALRNTKKLSILIIAAIVLIATIFSGQAMYQATKSSAENFAPSIYNQQWQNAMSWVRENTSSDAVFAHWWDYGYWIQSIGERATVLDGGNVISYWNHLMGRHALTSPNETSALEFLYSHNVTHFLIDSTDIGKYSAYSFIGSDTTLDRRSWIPALLRDNSQTLEKKNSTVYVYPAGISLDSDIIETQNGERVFLPAGKAALWAILIEKPSERNSSVINQPQAIFAYQGKQYTFSLRYAYYNGKLIDFGSGIESGIYIFPRLMSDGSINMEGALLYLSERTVNSQLAKLYLFNQESSYFELVHSEDDFIVSQIKSQIDIGDMIYYNGFRGPIKIWGVSYPEDIKFREEYLETEYPEEIFHA